MSHQVVRRGAESWEITRVERRGDGAGHDYETVAWVRRVGKFFHVFLPEWEDDGIRWVEQSRQYVLAETAVKSVTSARKKMVQ